MQIRSAAGRDFHADFRNFPEPDIQQLDCLEAQTRLYSRLFPAAHVAELADALGSGFHFIASSRFRMSQSIR